MKRLGLIRHAKSDWGTESLADINRPLNSRGYRDAEEMALRLKAKGLYPDLMISSPAVRAMTTALVFSRVFGLTDKQIEVRQQLYEANEKDFMQVLHHLPDGPDSIFVFAHNETITNIANKLSDQPIAGLPTCGVVVLESRNPRWMDLNKLSLLLYDYPKSKSEK